MKECRYLIIFVKSLILYDFPMCGLVQVPCIERNAIAASRALDSCTYAMLSDGKHKITFDHIVEVMRDTGHDLPILYKETSTGGIAKIEFKKKK